MKRGPNDILDDTHPSQKQKIEKSLETLLEEVSAGHYQDFQAFLIQEGITKLALRRKARNIDLACLGEALKGTNVTALDLGNNNIDDDGAARLGEGLKGTKVTTLALFWIKIGDDGAAKLGKALKGTKVDTLDLRGNRIGPNGAARLGEALKGTKVTNLDLEWNNIGDDGAASLGKALRDTKVTALDLGSNRIGPDGAVSLGETLKDTNIATLGLEGNRIGPDGAARLGKALKGTKITTLYLGDNNIGPDGAASLAQNIPGTLLFEVNLDFDNKALKAALEKNYRDVFLKPYYYVTCIEDLPKDVHQYISGFFPLMNTFIHAEDGTTMTMAKKVVQIYAKKQPEIQPQDETTMLVENEPASSRQRSCSS